MKILIIDDSSFILTTVFKALSNEFSDAQIEKASNGMEGFSKYQSFKPDVIVSDLLMPEMTGQEMISKIRETDKETKIFVVSADIQAATKNEVIDYGISGFINKPLQSEKLQLLISCVREACNA